MEIATLGIRVDATSARQELDNLTTTSNRTTQAMSSSERAASSMGKAMNALAGALSGLGVAAFAKGVLDTNREMESLRASLKSTMGTTEAAAAAFNSISDFAKTTPFEIKGLTQTFVMLQNMGIKPTHQVMEALTNQASKLGGSQETLTTIAMQLGQAHSKGKLQMEDMTVLMERGVPVMKLLADITGKNGAELADMSAKGTITNDVIDKLIIKMGEMSAGSNANAMDTLNGKISSLSDAWHSFEDTLLDDKSEGFIKKIVSNWTDWLDYFRESMASVGKEFQALDEINGKIVQSKAKISALSQGGVSGAAWKVVGALTGDNLAGEQNRLNDLLAQRDGIIKSTHDVVVAKNQEKAATDSLLNSTEKETKTIVETKDAKKEHEKATKAAQKAIDDLNKSFESTKTSLSLHNVELSKTPRELEEATLASKGYTSEMIKQAMALYDLGVALDAKKKINETEKSEMISLTDQYNKLTMSARDYYASTLTAKNIPKADQAPLLTQFDKVDAADKSKKVSEDAKAQLDSYNKSLSEAKNKTSDLSAVTTALFDGALGGINLVAGAFDNMVNSIAANTKALEENAKAQETNKLIADPKVRADNAKKYAKEEAALNAKIVSDQIAGASQMAGAAAKMFDKKSAAAKGFHAIEIGLSVLRLAMDAKEMASSLMKTGTNIAEGASKMFAQSGWAAFAGVAAMIALMATLGFSKNGGGGSSTPPPTDTGTGTVLGDTTAVSESIAKTNDLLKNIHAAEYTELRGINAGVSALKTGTESTINKLFQMGGIKDPSIQGNLGLQGVGGMVTTALSIDAAIWSGGLSYLISKIPVIGDLIGGAINWIANGLFGGNTKQEITGGGIQTGAASVGNIMNGQSIGGQQYTTVKKTVDGGWFGSDKVSYYDVLSSLDAGVTDSLTKVYKAIGKTMLSLASVFGGDLTAQVNATIIPSLRVEFRGLSGEDAAKKLNGVISATLDTMSANVFGSILGQYQKLGEGMLETAVRVASEIAVVRDALKQSGLKLLSKDIIGVSDAIVQAAGSLEEFQKQFEGYYDKFYSESEKTARLNTRLTDSLAMVGLKLADTRAGYRAQIDALDMTNALDQQRYSTLLELSSAADQYYASLEAVRNSMKLMTQDNFQSAFDYKKYLSLASLSGIQSATDALGWGANTFVPTGQEAIGQLPTVKLPVATDTPVSVAISAVADSNSAVVTEVRALRVEQQAQALALAQNTADTARIIKRWDGDGMPAVRTTV